MAPKKKIQRADKKKKGEIKSFVNVDASITPVKDNYEVFEVEKEGKEKEIIQPIKEEVGEKAPTQEQIKKENKIIRDIILTLMGFVILFVSVYLIIYFTSHFDYKGVDFVIDKQSMQGMTLYKTSVPVISSSGAHLIYNFWFRSDPREFEKTVPVNGSIIFKKNIVLDVTTENLFCDGYWNLALANLQKLSIFDINLLAKNETAKYVPETDFMFITINEANKTEITRIDGYHYEINVSNCEILPVAERLLIEAIVKANK